MTTKNPLPVTAYAAVSPDGGLDLPSLSSTESTASLRAWLMPGDEKPTVTPVTIIPTEQYEAMVKALEHIADPLTALRNEAEAGGHRLNGMAYQIAYDSHQLIKVAKDALAALKEQDNG